MSKVSPRSGKTAAELEEPGPSRHPKKAKNAKDHNIGKGAKKRMNKAKKYGTGGSKKR